MDTMDSTTTRMPFKTAATMEATTTRVPFQSAPTLDKTTTTRMPFKPTPAVDTTTSRVPFKASTTMDTTSTTRMPFKPVPPRMDTTTTRMPFKPTRFAPKIEGRIPSSVRPPPAFWKNIHNKVRTNSYAYKAKRDDGAARGWTFRSRKSHILDTQGHFQWKRELNCFQGQSLPDAVFPHNTLEITVALDPNSEGAPADDKHDFEDCVRIRFGALEGLRGWMSLDSEPIPTTHARDSAHWKRVAAQEQLLNSSIQLGGGTETIISATSYDYAYTTPYKGGTDSTVEGNGDDDKYGYLKADSTSFVPKHDAGANDLPAAGAAGIQRVKLRRPICKCKGDGGRAPFVSKTDIRRDGLGDSDSKPMPLPPPSRIARAEMHRRPLPQWIPDSNHKVDIEGMLRRADQPFLFREDVDLWQDDLHENGTAWLKARCFVCKEGWACLLRNFVLVNGVVGRVIDTRYIHTFGTSAIYREHSWREGPWDDLVRAIHQFTPPPPIRPVTTTTTVVNRHQSPRSPYGPSPVSLESINDSIAARYLPLKKPAFTERLSLAGPSLTNPTVPVEHPIPQQLAMINDSTIEDAIPVPNLEVQTALGISFVLKRAKGTRLDAISSAAEGEAGCDSLSFPVALLWSKKYGSGSNKGASATVLTLRISPDPSDGGRIAIGDDRGRVNVWRLATGEPLWGFPVAPQAILNRLEKNPYFESARLWVDHLTWSSDGSMVGASAGRNAVMASAPPEDGSEKGRVLSSLESNSGTVTGLAFRDYASHLPALAVASYGEIFWLTVPNIDAAKENRTLKTLKREGAAVECIDISPDGKTVAVGFLDKTLRVFTMDTNNLSATSTLVTTTHTPFTPAPSKDGAVVDWVGFNAPVKSVKFGGHWLAAMGGSTVLVLRPSLSPRMEAPIVCRTPGRTEADGGDGTCHRFAEICWSTTGRTNEAAWLLAALDAQTGSIHVFRFSDNHNGEGTNQLDAWPIRAQPVLTVSPSFRNPSPFATTRFSFFANKVASKQEDDELSFLVLERSIPTEGFSFQTVR